MELLTTEKSGHSTMEEKIERLADFCKNNPKIWRDKAVGECESDEKRNLLIQELENAQRYYSYVIARRTKGKLSKEDEIKLKEAGVNGVFGYPTYIEEIAKSSNMKEIEIQDLIETYGNIESLKEEYIRNLLVQQVTGKQEVRHDGGNLLMTHISMCDTNMITTIDISSPNLVYNNRNYLRLIKEIYGHIPTIVNGNKLEQEIDRLLSSTLTERDAQLLRERFGLDNGIWQRREDLAQRYQVNRSRIGMWEKSSIRKLSDSCKQSKELKDAMHSELTLANREKLIRNFFETHVFYDSNQKIDEQTQKDWLDLYYDVMQEKEQVNTRQVTAELNKDEQTEILKIGISELDLSVRPFNILRRKGIQTVGQLVAMTENDLMELKNMGKRSLEEIQKKIHSMGLHFAGEVDFDKLEEPKQSLTNQLQASILELRAAYEVLEGKEKRMREQKTFLIGELERISSNKQRIRENIAQIECLIRAKEEHNFSWLEERLDRMKKELEQQKENQTKVQMAEADVELQRVADEKAKIKSDIDNMFQDL